MARCPECGGEMTSHLKKKVCESCGLAVTPDDLDNMWDKLHEKKFEDERRKKTQHQEYLEWYQSSKK